MKKTTSGFTVVELLIVIIVIAILAAVSVVAYNGIQARAQDNANLQNVRAIQKAMELYRAEYGIYPPRTVTAPEYWGGCGVNNGYSTSLATNDSWMRELVTKEFLLTVPVHTKNDCSHSYRYIKVDKSTYGCTSNTSDYYVLEVFGTEGTTPPLDSATKRACPESSTQWPVNANKWVFSAHDS